jgi:hypothetical protein
LASFLEREFFDPEESEGSPQSSSVEASFKMQCRVFYVTFYDRMILPLLD